ncbi:hypothetical protein EBR66_01580 [bacterium]|nr:hypothetical protein [bacterium]
MNTKNIASVLVLSLILFGGFFVATTHAQEDGGWTDYGVTDFDGGYDGVDWGTISRGSLKDSTGWTDYGVTGGIGWTDYGVTGDTSWTDYGVTGDTVWTLVGQIME